MIIIAEVSELTRKIKLPTDRVISVNGDYQVDGIAFKLPATYEGDFDFSTAAVRVHWTGVDKVEHTNLITEEDGNGYPLWIMPSELTQGGHGVIEFAVSFIATDETAAVTKRWISDPVSFRNRRTVNGSSEDEAEEEAIYDRLASAIAAVRAAQASVDKVNEVLAGITNSSPVVVATAADLSDLDVTKHQLAIVRADGYLYYYDGSAWQKGIKYGSYELDTTLTESGKAADAAAVGAKISQIKEDLNQIEDLENPSMFLTWETGGISVTTGEDIENSAYRRISGYIPMKSVIKVVNDPSVAGYIYIYEKENDVYTFLNIINLSGEYLVKRSSKHRYLRVAIQSHETQKIQITKNAVINETIEEHGMAYNNYLYLENGSLNGSDGKDVAYQHVNRTDYIAISEFGTLFVNPLYRSAIFVYDSTHTRIYSTQWANFIKIDKDLIYESTNTTAENAIYCRIIFSRALQDSHFNDYLDPEIVKQANVYYTQRYHHTHRSFYDKKIISIYGDSISTFSGWIPEGNATYYTGSNAGVKNVYDTWWMKTISALGANLLVNNSWSGRAVSSIRDNTSGHETDAGYKEANVLQLKNGDILPEVIIVKLGINDFNSGAVLGDYDGSGTLPTDPTKFLDAYAIMLNLIMTNYPLAEVYCCTLMQCERSGSIGFPEINSRGNSLGQWNDGIKKLAHAFGAKVLDHDVCGITYYNMSTYMGDYSSGSGLHPNAKGHSLIANQTIHEIDNAVRIRF